MSARPIVVDSSAVLAFLLDEPGATEVEQALLDGAIIGAANWSEIVQKLRQHGRDVLLTIALLESYGLAVEPVVRVDGEHAANAWKPGDGLSLADRLCLALAERVDAEVLTADTAWGSSQRIRQIR